MEVKSEYLAIFSEEAQDQLREWEESLLALEKAPGGREPLNNLFRAVHSLKGSAGFIGFDLLQKLTHELESSLSAVRDGQRAYDGELSDLLFQGLDLARSLIETFSAGSGATAESAHAVEDLLSRLLGAAVDQDPSPAAPASAVAPSAAVRTSRLVVRIEGQNREAYLRSCLVEARLGRLGTVQVVEPDPEALRDSTDPFVYTVTVSSSMDADQIVSSISIDQVTVSPAPAASAPAEEFPASAAASTLPGKMSEASEKKALRAAGGELRKGSRPEEVVRVSVQKLDALLNLVGELVVHNSGFIATTQALRDQYGKTRYISDLEEKTGALSVITRDLQDGIMKARMLPIANVFNRFRRVVRDLAKASGKSVILDVFGEDTEIDKKVIDRIGEPLVHLVRNGVDHGLEPAADRQAAGKPEAGTIRLGAYQNGDHICIEVSDDGRGLDRKAILRRALEKGLISPEEAPRASTEQILGFIFLPGFSTARVVTDISGRGVGMDAVKRAVEEMNGSLRVRSAPGAGTTVTISLPLTMAIIGAVLVEASESTYAIPVSAVREIVKATEPMLKTVGTRPTMLLRNEVLALVNLARALKSNGETASAARALTSALEKPAAQAAETRTVVVVDYEGRKIGLEVDRIIGSREVVIKSLSRNYREVEGLIGASILGDGTIALIVDVETMISRHHSTGKGSLRDAAAAVRKTARAVESTAQAMPSAWVPAARAAAVLAPAAPAPAVLAPAAPAPAVPAPAPAAPIVELAREVAGGNGRLLEDVNNQGALEASMSLSQLTGQGIRVSFPESRLVAIRDIAEMMGGEESIVGGMYVGVRGDLEAGMLLVIPEANLLVLDDLLHRRPVGTTGDLASVDLSGISEMGNLLASSFLNAMADAAHLSLNPQVPEISIDMCQSVVDSVLARFNQPGDSLLLTEAVVYGGGTENVVCHQVLFLEPGSLRKLMDALAASAAGSTSAAGNGGGVPNAAAARGAL